MKNMLNKKEQLQYDIDNAYLGLGNVADLDLKGPFSEPLFEEENLFNPPMQMMKALKNPKYLPFFAKYFLAREPLPFQGAILKELWTKPFPMLIETRGGGKTFILALYAMLRALITQGCKIVVVGAAFRQSKQIFNYMVNMWDESPILRDICGDDKTQGPHTEPDKCLMRIGRSEIIAVPLGTGDKIRGLRANYIIADEFHSIVRAIFENVIIGFAAVSGNPVENVKRRASHKMLKNMGLKNLVNDDFKEYNNQTVIAGTAYYTFNHFYEYFTQYHKIISSRGDPRKLKEIFPDGVPDNLDWKDFSIIRIPHELLPDGYMDDKHIAKAKATTSHTSFLIEYSCIFPTDSTGFYKRSIIDSCVCKFGQGIKLPSGEVSFTAMLVGDNDKEYVLGIDPASESDNFSMTVLEINPDHRRLVYVWTTNKTHYNNLVKKGLTGETDYYGFCARKIRALMRSFNIIAIALDMQGGGRAIESALQSSKTIEEGEKLIYEIIDDDKPKPTDDRPGLHIIHPIEFVDPKWTSNANYGLRFDLESKNIIFPEFDTISINMAMEEDKVQQRSVDTLEDCLLEIEETKNELTSIVMTQTEYGRDKWSTPEIKLPGGRKGKQRKDRYSSLLMANAVVTSIMNKRNEVRKTMEHFGKFVERGGTTKSEKSGPQFTGPAWYLEEMKRNRLKY